MNNSVISVIVPAYNCVDTLDRCIMSIIAANIDGLEVLIINDGSKDNTLQVAEALAANWNNVRVISQQNQGVSVARNAGIRHARGKYVAFVDSDDWILAPYSLYGTLYTVAEENNADIVIAGYTTSKASSNLILSDRVYNLASDCEFEDLIQLKSIGKPYGKLVRREFLVNNDIYFPVGMRHQEDAVFLYKMLTYAKVVVTNSDVSYFYDLPEQGKSYSSSIDDELKGYVEMRDAIDILLRSRRYISKCARERLEQRKINMALHVYAAIQKEVSRNKRILGYKGVDWFDVVSQLDTHLLKKWLLKNRLYVLADLV